jgi:cyclophilin family peptidyl-prolyl cis-trans isomerase
MSSFEQRMEEILTGAYATGHDSVGASQAYAANFQSEGERKTQFVINRINEFFLCVGDQPELDFGGKRNPDGQGFAAFGRAVKGMDVVRAIQAAPAEGQALTPPIKVLKVTRLR